MTPEHLAEIEERVKCRCPQWCLDTPPEEMPQHDWDDCHRYCPQHGEGFLQRIDEWKLVVALKEAWRTMDEVAGEMEETRPDGIWNREDLMECANRLRRR